MKVTINGVVTEGTPEEIKEYFELLGADAKPKGAEDTPKFKDGDRVKALVAGEFRDVKAGEIGEITDTDEGGDGDPYIIEVTTDDDCDYFRPQDLELLTDAETPKTIKRKARVGERILITDASSSGSQYDNGDILTVRKVVGKYGTYDAIQAEGVSIGIFDYEYEVIGEECAEAKRKPGEFKEGDIVRGKRNLGDVSMIFGEMTDEGDPDYSGNYGIKSFVDGRYRSVRDVELIAPVEARVDGSFE